MMSRGGFGLILRGVALFGVVLLATPRLAYGYLDPVSGSLVLQVVAAALLAGLLTVKRVWLWFGSLFRVRGRQNTE